MAHLPRFHRRKKDVAAPTLITSDLPGRSAPAQGDSRSSSPARSFQKLSPFRVFHRSSGKRARDSPPASLPHSPAAAPVVAGESADGRPVSPLSLRSDSAGDDGQKRTKPAKMPAFLKQNQQEIENKFSELVWRERNRLMQSVTNPSPDFRWARVTGPHLKVLDRYLNVQPWHNNRIKLQVPDGHVDYINASPIVVTPRPYPTAEGTIREPDRYIAMQGPKQASADHTWRMVVEQLESPGVIVMLTETHEGHMEKCFPYFPRSKDDPPIEVNERDEFGDGFRATVRCEGLEETPAGDAIELRKLVIRIHSRPKPGTTIQPVATPSLPDPDSTGRDPDTEMTSPFATTTSSTTTLPNPPPQFNPLSAHYQKQQGQQQNQPLPEQEPEEKIIYHFLYKKWPDFGVPHLSDLDSFFTLMRLSREKNARPSNPRIIHCSAGVGRSGTFIALEHLMREMERGVFEDWDERAALMSGVGFGSEGQNGEDGDSTITANHHGGDGEEEGDEEEEGWGSSPVVNGQGEDPVFETVDLLREQRRTMVQAEAQYGFIYQVLRKLWEEKYGGGGGDEAEGKGDGEGDEVREPAAKRLEVEPPTTE
ncbi:phosphatases II [Parathielavia appendiculata]|uniref:Phosphatases II n=1 Tax=Parathielavia appendiculata TaxID=2587402 RepID=A0AAN6Z4F6_9PEZI|nr:phosphatases II [Parathielavia appendiculata]